MFIIKVINASFHWRMLSPCHPLRPPMIGQVGCMDYGGHSHGPYPLGPAAPLCNDPATQSMGGMVHADMVPCSSPHVCMDLVLHVAVRAERMHHG